MDEKFERAFRTVHSFIFNRKMLLGASDSYKYGDESREFFGLNLIISHVPPL